MMTITLTPDQERAIQEAIESGMIGSVDEFLEKAIEALPCQGSETQGFDPAKARQAAERMKELRKGVRLERGNMSLREFAHIGHRY
jgi:Arc/MetJ-type ribon-helix-helix transcriptional regulator